MRDLPNMLTWLRVALAPALVVCFFVAPEAWRDPVVAAVFLLAAATDFLDGHFARRYNTHSSLGAALDPIADKMVVITALLLLLAENRAHFVAIYIIIMREVVISFLREWMTGKGKTHILKVSGWGKSKTFFQMLAVSLLLFNRDLAGLPLADIGRACLWIAVLLTLWSMWDYCRAVYLEERDSGRG